MTTAGGAPVAQLGVTSSTYTRSSATSGFAIATTPTLKVDGLRNDAGAKSFQSHRSVIDVDLGAFLGNVASPQEVTSASLTLAYSFIGINTIAGTVLAYVVDQPASADISTGDLITITRFRNAAGTITSAAPVSDPNNATAGTLTFNLLSEIQAALAAGKNSD